MRKFKDLKIWQLGMEIAKEIYLISNQLPKNEQFGLRNQITRAAVSIPSNIAEGSSRTSNADFKRFLEIALGSLFELETQLLLIQKLDMINQTELNNIFNQIEQESKMINSFIQKAKSFHKNTQNPKPKT